MRGLQGQGRGVSGILAGVILFAMLFSVGIGFYVYINQTNGSISQANANKQNAIQQSSLENLTLSATANAGVITVTATNRGGVGTSLLTAFVDNSNGVLQNPPNPDPFTITGQPTLDVGQSVSFTVPGYSYVKADGNVTVSVITGRGNTFTAQYPPPRTGTQTDVVVNSQSTTVYASVSGGGSNALVVTMTATPPVTFNCANECVTDSITIYNYALSPVTNVALNPAPPSVIVCGAGNTPGCTATLTSAICPALPNYSNGQPDANDSIHAYSGSGNAPYVTYVCTFNANTGSVGGFASFSGEATGILLVTGQQVASAIATSNTIEIGGQANVITQGAFTANFTFYKYSACQTAPQSTGSHGGYPSYAYTGVTTGAYPCNPTPSQITNPGTMNDRLLDDAFLLYSAANYYVAYYVSLTNDFNQTLPILQYSYLYMDPGISGEQYYFLAGAATDYYHTGTNTYSSYYPNYNVANSVPALDAYSATPTTCSEVYNAVNQNYTAPSPSTCINIHPGQTLTLTFAACGWNANTWDWGGTAYANQFDSPATNCNINSVPGYGGNVPEGQVVSIEVTYMYKNIVYSQLLPFDGQFILNQYMPSISTLLSPSTIQAGQSVTDSATLSSASPFAGGTVQYEYFSSGTCSGSPTNVGSAVTVTNGVVPNSPAQTFNTAGSYGYEAVYSGDSQDTGATSPCEPLTVTKATPSIATTLGSGGTVPAGTPITDLATLSAFSGSNVGGTVTFYYSTTNSCPTGGATQVGSAITVSSSGTATSGSATFNTVGTYYWYAVYSGDSNNVGVTSACETLTVIKASPTISTSLSASTITVGSSDYDTATLASDSGSNTGGTVTYSYYSGSSCSGSATTVSTVTVSAGSVPNSASVTFTSAGSYSWNAAYSGDGNNNGATSACETLTVNKASPTITTSLSASSINAGGSVHDSATMSSFYQAGGTATYSYYSGSSCTGSATVVSTVTVTNGVVPNSASQTFSTAGPYSWNAAYSGDANNNAATSACETLAVMASPTISTTLSATTITAGSSVHDSATLTGATGTAGGTVQYEYFSSGTCTGSPTNVGSAVTVTNGIVPNSASQTFNSVGSYGWEAVYSGDTYNNGATSSCEAMTVNKASPTISTSLSANPITAGGSASDSATLTGATSTAGGTVTYYVYSNSACSSGQTQVSQVTVTNGVVPNSASHTFGGVGTYSWNAVYSGDSNNNGATSSCETITVNKASPTISTTLSTTTVSLGGSAYDTATLSGSYQAGGTVTYNLYSGSTCSGSATVVSTVTVTTGTVPNSASHTFNAAGSYSWTAVYSGDANNNGATSSCETMTVNKGLDPGGSSHTIVTAASSSTSATATISTSDSGDLIYACVFAVNQGTTLNTPTASGLTFSSRVASQGTSTTHGTLDCWYATASGTLTNKVITFTYGGSNGGIVIAVASFNVPTPVVFDGSASTAFGSSSPASTSVTTGNANDIIFSFTGVSANTAITAPGAPYTTLNNVQSSANGVSGADSYQLVTNTGTYSPSFTFSTGHYGIVVDAIDPPAGSSGAAAVTGITGSLPSAGTSQSSSALIVMALFSLPMSYGSRGCASKRRANGVKGSEYVHSEKSGWTSYDQGGNLSC